MKTRPTPAHLALWSALPMAETSQVEKRLTMILDTSRSRRTLTRRTGLAMLALASAALVPLAMIHSVPKARAASDGTKGQAQAAAPVQLVGITDATVPGSEWWNAEGERLAGKPFSRGDYRDGRKITTQPHQSGRFFAFHLSPALRNVPVLYDISNQTQGGLTISAPAWVRGKKFASYTWTAHSLQSQTTDADCVYGATFPANLSRTTVRVGAGSGPWKRAASIKFVPHSVTYFIENTSGNTFTLGKLEAERGRLWLGSTSGDSVDVRLIAVDRQGRQTQPVETDRIDDKGTGRVRATFAHPLRRIKEIQVETRPFVWTEFKNVALQPAPPSENGTGAAKP